MTRLNLDELHYEHLGTDGTYSEFLRGRLIQSLDPPPPWIDRKWVREPDIGWRWDAPIVQFIESGRTFTPVEALPEIDPDEWLERVAGSPMRPERRAVAVALADYADFGTGRNVRPSVLTLARVLGRERARVNTHVRRLLADGWLAATGKASRGVIVYALTTPDAESGTQPLEVHRRGVRVVEEGDEEGLRLAS